MAQEQVHAKSHYRTLHNGKVVWVHDYDANHEVNHRSREAHFHERTTQGVHTSGAHYLRATDEDDAKHIRRAATELGIASSEETREANHHGNVGRFTHFDFATPEEAATVRQLAEAKARPHETPIPKELGGHDEVFAQIFGDVQLPPEISQDEWDSQYEAIFGILPKLPALEIQRNVTITSADIGRLKEAFELDEFNVEGERSFITFWNTHVRLNIEQALGPIVKELNGAHPACLAYSASAKKRLTLSGNGSSMHFGYGNAGLSCSRHYDFDMKTVEHSLWELPRTIRGDGLGKKVFQESIRFYDAAGIKKINVHANIDVGSYCWARYRFRPNNSAQWNHIKSVFKGNANGLPPAFRNDPDLTDILATTDTRAAWALSDYISEKVAIGEAAARGNGGVITQEARNRGGILRTENPMLRFHWYGHINLGDNEHRQMVMDYITDKPSRARKYITGRRRT